MCACLYVNDIYIHIYIYQHLSQTILPVDKGRRGEGGGQGGQEGDRRAGGTGGGQEGGGQASSQDGTLSQTLTL
jgi:uncharacterized membrane protein YgcG